MNFGPVSIPSKLWGADVARHLNEISRSITTPGQLYSDLPIGRGSSPLPKNRRDKVGVVGSRIVGCFDIESINAGTITFKNRYLRVASKTFEISTLSMQNAVGFVCLEISAKQSGDTLPFHFAYTSYANLAALQAAENNFAKVVIPLYKLNNDATGVELDMRFIPTAVKGEIVE